MNVSKFLNEVEKIDKQSADFFIKSDFYNKECISICN